MAKVDQIGSPDDVMAKVLDAGPPTRLAACNAASARALPLMPFVKTRNSWVGSELDSSSSAGYIPNVEAERVDMSGMNPPARLRRPRAAQATGTQGDDSMQLAHQGPWPDMSGMHPPARLRRPTPSDVSGMHPPARLRRLPALGGSREFRDDSSPTPSDVSGMHPPAPLRQGAEIASPSPHPWSPSLRAAARPSSAPVALLEPLW